MQVLKIKQEHSPERHCSIEGVRMRSKIAVALFLGSVVLQSWAAQPWSSFNGFYAGMSKQDALKAGAERCRQGQGISERTDSIYCFIPAKNLKVGNARAEEGKLEFKEGKLGRVDNISLRFKDDKRTVTNALDGVYGQARESFDNGEEANITEWQHGDSYSVELRGDGGGRYNSVYVELKYDPAAGKARRADAAAKSKMAKALDSFNKH